MRHPRTHPTPPLAAPVAVRPSLPVSVRVLRQQRWLLFLRHANSCTEECDFAPHCSVARRLRAHMSGCDNLLCRYPRCVYSRWLLKHFDECEDAGCPNCSPLKCGEGIALDMDIKT